MGCGSLYGAFVGAVVVGCLVFGARAPLADSTPHPDPSIEGAASPADVLELADVDRTDCREGLGDEIAALVQSRYEGIRDIHANFEQTNESASFAGQAIMNTEPKSGRVVFAKPGKMRWTYLMPEPSVVVSNGSVLWIYDVLG